MSGLSKLLMSKPALDNQGVLDLGKNCYLCNQLDFLPFHCELCDHTYCSQHRNVDIHNCKLPEKQTNSSTYHGPSAASLFPDPETRQKALEELFQKVAVRLANLIAKEEKSKSTPIAKLRKFLQIQKSQKAKDGKNSFLSKLKLQKPESPVVQISALKKVAKGAPNVQIADRIYIWTLYINRNEEDLDKISEEKEKIGLWILRNWSVGRSLDLIADQLKIMNRNNSTSHTNERLSLFRVSNDEPVALDLSKKNQGYLKTGDTLYLVKG